MEKLESLELTEKTVKRFIVKFFAKRTIFFIIGPVGVSGPKGPKGNMIEGLPGLPGLQFFNH